MPMKVKKTEQQHVDEGEYKAVVADIQEKQGNWGKYYVWTFLVKNATDDGEELEGNVKVTGLTSEVFSEGSKMCKWAKAAGIDVEEDEIDLDDAKKAIVKVYIEDDESKKEGRIFSKVSKVKPYKKGKAKQAEEDDNEDDEEEAPKKKSKEKKQNKKQKKAKPVEDEIEDDEAEEEEEEEEEKPKKKKKKGKKKEPEQEEDEEEIDEEDDEDDEGEDDEELFDFDDDDD